MRKSLFAMVLFSILLLTAMLSAAPVQITHQGRLTDAGGRAVDSFFDITFRIYSDSTGVTHHWQETQGVNVVDGLFSVRLGTTTPLDFSEMPAHPDFLWLGIQLGSDIELAPRTRLSSVPSAGVASALQGDVSISEGLFVMLNSSGDTTLIWDANARKGVVDDLHPPGNGTGHGVSMSSDDSSGSVEMVAFNDVDSSNVIVSAIESRSTLKTYFETGDIPTEASIFSTTDTSGMLLRHTTGSWDTEIVSMSLSRSASLTTSYGNGIDDDCDGVVSADSSGASLRASWGDGLDNDCDGVVSADSSGASLNISWGNGIDDDCDGIVSADRDGASMTLGASDNFGGVAVTSAASKGGPTGHVNIIRFNDARTDTTFMVSLFGDPDFAAVEVGDGNSSDGGIVVTSAVNLLDHRGHVTVLKMPETDSDTIFLARLFGDPDFAALELKDPQGTSEKSRGITINTSHIESSMHLGDNTFGSFDPTAIDKREMYLGVEEFGAKFALGQEGIKDDDLSQGMFAEVTDTSTTLILTDPNGAARFAIREGGRTVGAGQVTEIRSNRMTMVDSIGDVGNSISLRRLDPDSDDDGLLDLIVDPGGSALYMNKGELVDAIASNASIVVDTTGVSFKMNKVDMVDDAELLEISMTIDSVEANLSLSKADAKRALEALTSSSRVGLYLIDSTLNDSGLIGMQIKDGNSGISVKSAKKVAKFKAGAALAKAVNKAVAPDANNPEGTSLEIVGDLDHFVEITVDSVSSSLVFADTLGDTTIVLGSTMDGSGELHIINPGDPAIGVGASSVTIADIDADGLMDVRVDGKIGIGVTNPTTILQVQQGSLTDPIADAWTTYSSRRWKENIKTINNAISKVSQLRGVEYDWKADGKHDIGLIAEEVGAVIPEVVVYEANGIDARSVDYPRLVALLIQASKEQQTEIESMRTELAELKAMMVKIAKQNQPNPDNSYGMK